MALDIYEANHIFDNALEQALRAYEDANDGQEWPGPGLGWYLAGPMTGRPQFNFPAFDAAALDLRRTGKLILSPAEMDDPAEREEVMKSKDGDPSFHKAQNPRAHYLKRDFLIVLEVEGVICLPDWELSSGARDETRIALALDKPVLRYPDLKPVTWDEHPYNGGFGPHNPKF